MYPQATGESFTQLACGHLLSWPMGTSRTQYASPLPTTPSATGFLCGLPKVAVRVNLRRQQMNTYMQKVGLNLQPGRDYKLEL